MTNKPWQTVGWWAWAGALMLLGLAAYHGMAGHSSSGPMNLDLSPVVLVALGLPLSALAPGRSRHPTGWRLNRVAAIGLVGATLWWQFWLPSVLIDVGYSLRYDIPDPYIWPASAGVPVIVLSLAVWLGSPPPPASALRGLGTWGLWVGLSVAAIVAVEWNHWLFISLATAGVCLLAGTAAMLVRHRLAARHILWRWVTLWLGAQLWLVAFWGVIYEWGDRLPTGLNAWGKVLIYGS